MRKKCLSFGIIVTLLAFLLLISGCVKLGNTPIGSGQVPIENPSPSPTPSIPLSPEPDRYETVSLLGVGDNLIHNTVYSQAKDRGVNGKYDFAFAYENVADIVSSADIAVLNQETPLASEVMPVSSYPQFNSPVDLGKHMTDIGFDVITHANNHIFDKGEKGVIATLDYWDTNPAATVIGAYRNKADSENIRTIIKKDITFSFVNFTYGTNGLRMPKGSDVTVILTSEEDIIKAQIKKAKEISDVAVVVVHWGTENVFDPTDEQRALAQKMTDWGADIIIGHHPHVIQPIEYLTAQDGHKTLVIYSLGNFISNQSSSKNMIGGMIDINITKNFQDGSISIDKAEFIPIVNHYEKGGKNIKIYPLSMYTPELADKHGLKSAKYDFSYDYIVDTVRTIIPSEFLAK